MTLPSMSVSNGPDLADPLNRHIHQCAIQHRTILLESYFDGLPRISRDPLHRGVQHEFDALIAEQTVNSIPPRPRP